MSITTLTKIQEHVDPDPAKSDLLCIHSPLVFIVDAEYDITPPDFIYASIYNVPEASLLGTYKMIPWTDTSSTHRQFIFISDPIIRGLMEDFPDFTQSGESLVAVPDITKRFAIKFHDPEEEASDVWSYFTALIATRQFGENSNAEEIFDNDPDTYYGAANQPIYIYFYNDVVCNVLTVEDHIHSEEMTGEFTRNNCPPGEEGTTVTFTTTYTSYVSKADLDAQVANFSADGQAYANANGSCTLPIFNYTFETLDNLNISNIGTGVSCISESNHLKTSWPSGSDIKSTSILPYYGGDLIVLDAGNYRMSLNLISIIGESGGGHVFFRILTDGTPVPNEWLEGEGLKEFDFSIDGTYNVVNLLFSSGSIPTVDFECIVDDWKLIKL